MIKCDKYNDNTTNNNNDNRNHYNISKTSISVNNKHHNTTNMYKYYQQPTSPSRWRAGYLRVEPSARK